MPTSAPAKLTTPSINGLLQSLMSAYTITSSSTQHKHGKDNVQLSSWARKTTRRVIYIYIHGTRINIWTHQILATRRRKSKLTEIHAHLCTQLISMDHSDPATRTSELHQTKHKSRVQRDGRNMQVHRYAARCKTTNVTLSRQWQYITEHAINLITS